MSDSSAARIIPNPKSSLRIKRRYKRIYVSCEAILAFPFQNTHSRIKAHLFQIGQGGCALSTEGRPFIGAECIVWALGAGQRYLGVKGKIVWTKPVYETSKGHNASLVGIQFEKPIELTEELLAHLKQRS